MFLKYCWWIQNGWWRGKNKKSARNKDGGLNCLKIGQSNSSLIATGGEDRKVNIWEVGQMKVLVVSDCDALLNGLDVRIMYYTKNSCGSVWRMCIMVLEFGWTSKLRGVNSFWFQGEECSCRSSWRYSQVMGHRSGTRYATVISISFWLAPCALLCTLYHSLKWPCIVVVVQFADHLQVIAQVSFLSHSTQWKVILWHRAQLIPMLRSGIWGGKHAFNLSKAMQKVSVVWHSALTGSGLHLEVRMGKLRCSR